MSDLELRQITDLSHASTSELKRELGRALEITSRHLVYLASIWRELESRGEDLSDLRHGIAAYLPMIAHGRINADLVVKYAGQKTLLSALSRMPISEQNRIAETGYVTVVRPNGDSFEEVQTPLSGLAATDIYRVFSDDGERSPAEQLRLLTKKTRAKKTRFRRARRVQIDADDHSIVVGSASVDIDRVVSLLSEHYGLDIAKLLEEQKRDGR